jgi:hypothetical protein
VNEETAHLLAAPFTANEDLPLRLPDLEVLLDALTLNLVGLRTVGEGQSQLRGRKGRKGHEDAPESCPAASGRRA